MATTTIHPYYIVKAREVFRRAGGDPANAMQVAEWAQETKQRIDSDPEFSHEIGVLVSEDGQIRAQVGVYGTEPRGWYVNETEHESARDLIADFATGRIGKEIGQRVIQINIFDVALGPAPKSQEKLTTDEAAKLAGIATSTFEAYVSRGQAPQPDGVEGRTNFWWAWTIEEWMKNRPGRGARTDLHA